MLGQVEKQSVGVGVVDNGADGNPQDDIGSTCAVLIFAAPVFTGARAMQSGIAEIDQRVDVAICLSYDAATVAAIAPVGAAFGNELLAAEAGHAIAAFASNDFNGGFIDKFHGVSLTGVGCRP